MQGIVEHASDFADTQMKAAQTYRQPAEWTRMSIVNVSGMGKFSSDRTIDQYATEVWDAKPVRVPEM